MSDWPASNDYTIAIQTPGLCFRDADLKTARVERTRLTGMPKVWTGNFAQVYELTGARGRWAVKCFTRSAVDIRTRYSKIAKAIAQSGLPYFVAFELLEDEMLVNGARYPVVKMQWIEGQPLDSFVEANLGRPPALLGTARDLIALVRDLERQTLAHGDLQHGNIVVTTAGVKLVDYDGLFVPAFAGTPAPERGLPAYQHPDRSTSDYGIGLDRFSLLVICTGLSALAADPNLWHEFSNGDNLLFIGEDFRHPRASRLFRTLGAMADPQVRTLARALTAACARRPLEVPLLEGPLSSNVVPRHGFWWVDPDRARAKTDTGKRPEPVRRKVRRRRTLALTRHPGMLTATGSGMVAIGAARLVSVRFGLLLAAFALVTYLIERIVRYNALPAVRRRRRLRAKVHRLEGRHRAQENRQAVAERRLDDLAGRRETRARREKLSAEIKTIDGRLSAISAALSQAERELKQLRIPTFANFLKHSF